MTNFDICIIVLCVES